MKRGEKIVWLGMGFNNSRRLEKGVSNQIFSYDANRCRYVPLDGADDIAAVSSDAGICRSEARMLN